MDQDAYVILRFVHLLGMAVWASGTLGQMVVSLPLRSGSIVELRAALHTFSRMQGWLALPGMLLCAGSGLGLVGVEGLSLGTLPVLTASKLVLTALGVLGTIGASVAVSKALPEIESFREDLGWMRRVARLVIGWRAGVSVTAVALFGGLILSTLR